MTTTPSSDAAPLRTAPATAPRIIALPEPSLSMDQDAEWCVAKIDGEWRQFRFHDYSKIYEVQGLYERIFYDILKCNSPATIRQLLEEELERAGEDKDSLHVLDLGAGNGMVGAELSDMGADTLVGVDITPAAAAATERDRPDVYKDYHVTDMTALTPQERERLRTFHFNCLTCVAALGFGDIPPKAFAQAYDLIETNGWLAFNIKEKFLNGKDSSGFSRLINGMIAENAITVVNETKYRHRIATDGRPLYYVAMIARKREPIPAYLLQEQGEA